MLLQAIVASNFLLAPIEISLHEVQQLEVTSPKITRIYLVRHGESAFNLPDAHGIKYTSGKSLSIPLTDKGKKQADDLGIKLKRKLANDIPCVILSSTAVRAQETADRILKVLKTDYALERGESYEGFCEMGQGIWEGKPKDKEYNTALKSWENLSAKDKFTYPKIIQAKVFLMLEIDL